MSRLRPWLPTLRPSGRSQICLQLTEALARRLFGILVTLPRDFEFSPLPKLRPIGYLEVAARSRLRCEKGRVWLATA